MNETTGIVLVDKPANLTSFQALGPLKRALGTRRVGHGGTLDRFATGLLILLSGGYTRLVPWFSGCNKTYRATAVFGVRTDTLDPEGTVIQTAPVPTEEDVRSVLPRFIGRILQAPPEYSAVHLNGRRAYERVLAGEKPEMKPRPVVITRLELETFEAGVATFFIECGSGTYIRSLARDIADEAGSCAHLSALRRHSIGPFTVEEAIEPDSFNRDSHLLAFTPVMAASLGLGVGAIDAQRIDAFQNGGVISSSEIELFTLPMAGTVLPTANAANIREENLASVAVFSREERFLGMADLSGSRVAYRFVHGGTI